MLRQVLDDDARLGDRPVPGLVAQDRPLPNRRDSFKFAVIGDSANAASIAVHASLGFVRAGNLRSTGYKFGRWVDSILMQLPIGGGDMSPPEGGTRDGTKP